MGTFFIVSKQKPWSILFNKYNESTSANRTFGLLL